MTYRVLVTGASDWTDQEVIARAVTQAVGGRDDAVVAVGDCSVGTDALAVAAAGMLGVQVEQHRATRVVMCWRCQRGEPVEGCGACESLSIRARNAAMIANGADVCLVFLTTSGPGPSFASRVDALRFARLARGAGIEVRKYSTPERKEQKRRANRAQATRRQAQIQANGPAESFTQAEIGERDGWICGICQDRRRLVDPDRKPPDPLSASIDHIVPISIGGTHTRANVRITHLWCNVSRNASTREPTPIELEHARAELTLLLDGTPIPEHLVRQLQDARHARAVARRKERYTALATPDSQRRWADRREYMIAVAIAAGRITPDSRFGEPAGRLQPFIRVYGEDHVRDAIGESRQQLQARRAQWPAAR